MSFYEKIKSALASEFIYSDDIARAVALAVESGKNLLLWGPAGHGKSEMIQRALSVVAADEDIFVQSFGEGMDEATLWGGLDFAALENEKVLRYFPEQSFLAKSYAVFEELFDAPSSVLLGLKDTLTARVLRKGSQRFAMKTRVIIALTNKDPAEVSELGPAAHALIERFPIQMRVAWTSYTSQDYISLFGKVAPRLPGADLNGTSRILAEMIAKAGEQGQPISPRSAVHALGVVKAAASLRGSAVVEKVDLLDLKFVDGMENLAESLQKEIEAAAERAAAEGRVVEAERKLGTLLAGMEEAKKAQSPIKLLQSAKALAAFGDEAASLKVTDGLTDRRKRVRDSASEKAAEAQKLALENTRV
ncbi:MAG: AAA family ATPase [Patescibacteria group bacterium]|nr:AAA family ATPase [Patescibacteria group bacterium]